MIVFLSLYESPCISQITKVQRIRVDKKFHSKCSVILLGECIHALNNRQRIILDVDDIRYDNDEYRWSRLTGKSVQCALCALMQTHGEHHPPPDAYLTYL